jgi:starch-binding outer membrane protein SusE/F
MKNFLKLGSLLLLPLLALQTSCKKEERPLNENFTPVATLSLPDDQASVQLQPTSTASVQFKWDAAAADDGGMVLYELAFDKEAGDFSAPVFKRVSNGGGVETQLTLTHKDLTKIAALGGIEASSVGKLKWTVIASKSTNKKVALMTRTIQLERPAGFAEIPANLYLTGSATEGGEDVTMAIPLKKIEGGVFEIYTSLKPGTYQLTDKPAADGKKFYVDGTVIKEGASATTVSGGTKVYRLKYDFNVATVLDATEIETVGLYMSAYNTEIGQLDYKGNGVWEAASIPVVFYPFSWGRDERYKFAFHTSAGVEYLGSSNVNNVGPVGQPAAYFYLNPVSNAQWDNTYKFNPTADNQNVKVRLVFDAAGAYTHEVTTL